MEQTFGKVKKPDPLFVHYGFGAGVSCCTIVSIIDETEHQLAVGTTNGKCMLFSPQTHMCTATVHEDLNGRSIVAVGQFSTDHIFLHIRAYAVLLLAVDSSCTAQILNFLVTTIIRTEFYGFCGALSHKSRLFYPFFQDLKCTINVFTDTSEQNTLELPGSSGSLMSFTVSDDGYMACGFENGSLRIMDTENIAVTDERKPFSETILSSAVFAKKLAVSSVKAPFKLFTIQEKRVADEKDILFPQKAGGCAALCFSNTGKEIASGYWDGSVRVHSIKTGTIRVVLHFHTETINCLHWNKINAQRLLFVGSRDAKLTIWNLYND